jgi:hypothetical protein
LDLQDDKFARGEESLRLSLPRFAAMGDVETFLDFILDEDRGK